MRLVALVPPRASPSLRSGLAFGTEEAGRTAALFGVVMTCDVAVYDEGGAALAASLGTRPDAVVSAVPGAAGARLLAAAAERDLVVVDVAGASPLPAMARAGARRIFHVHPLADGDSTTGTRALWHESLHRYGAEQLNDRFERRFGAPMDSTAWAAWFAVKLLADTLLRLPDGATTADVLATAIARGGFDGHKGRSLSFDPVTGVLRQPLYAIGRDPEGRETVLREIPPEPPDGDT